jgi:hypothetical protein
MGGEGASELDAMRERRVRARLAGRPLEPLVGGPEHELLARRVAGELRALVGAAEELAALVSSWDQLAGMCGLFDGLAGADAPGADWRARIEQALARIEEATA